MRKLTYILFFLLSACDADGQRVMKGAVQVPPDFTAVVYIFAGQSNQPETISTYFQALMDAATTKRVVTIWFAQPGSSIMGGGGTNDWKISENTQGTNYATLKSTILTTLADVVADGYTPIIRGFDWMQGEADSNGCCGYTDVQLQAEYTLQLSRLIQFLADDINEAGYDVHNMRITVGRVHATYPSIAPTMLAAIRAAQVDMNNFRSLYVGYNDLVRSVVWRDTDGYPRDAGLSHLTVPAGQQAVAADLYTYYSQYIDEVNTLTTINTFGFDADAIAYLSANQCHNQTQANALNALVVTAKADSWWTSYVALYPIMGGHRVAHRVNLKNPANTDGAYRLTFNKGLSHVDNGFFGGFVLRGYINTNVPFSSLGQNTAGAVVYSKTSAQDNNDAFGVLTAGNTSRLTWTLRSTSDQNLPALVCGPQTGLTTTDASGIFIMSRTSSSNFNTWIHGTKRSYAVTSIAPDANTIFMGARNNNGTPGTYNSTVFAFFGLSSSSLSDANELSIRTAVNTFQTAIGR